MGCCIFIVVLYVGQGTPCKGHFISLEIEHQAFDNNSIKCSSFQGGIDVRNTQVEAAPIFYIICSVRRFSYNRLSEKEV